jgi:uncharacterized RDD family membrane protein YckC
MTSPLSASSRADAGGDHPGAPVYPKGPLGARFLATVIDVLVGCAAFIPALLVAAWGLVEAFGSGSSSSNYGEPIFVVAMLLALAGGIWSIYYGFAKDGRAGGASIGKAKMGLMVVRLADKRPCTPGQSALRVLTLIILNVIPAVGWLIEPVVVLAADDGRRLGDKAAGTQVIAVADYRV